MTRVLLAPATAIALALAPTFGATGLLSAQGATADGPANKYGNTLKRTPRPTTAAITENDLKTRLYIFADDSMMGRQVGREGNMKGTNYIAAEMRRLGLEPGGDNGTYFQGLPYYLRYYSSDSRLSVGNSALRFGTDFLPMPAAGRPPVQNLSGVQVIYGGVVGDTLNQISASQATGRIVVLTEEHTDAIRARTAAAVVAAAGQPAGQTVRVSGNLQVNDQTVAVLTQGQSVQAAADSVRAAVVTAAGRGGGRGALAGRGGRGGGRGGRGGRGGGGRGGGGRGGAMDRFLSAVAIITIDLADMTPTQLANLTTRAQRDPGAGAAAVQPGSNLGAAPAPVTIRVSEAAAQTLMGVPLGSLLPGAAGREVSGQLNFVNKYTPEYARNVVAIIRGSDPVLRDEYVAIGAHNDHTGFNIGDAVDHDSLKAFRDAVTKLQIRGRDTLLNATLELADAAKGLVNFDSLRELRPLRRDSVRNGADDDGSGSMGVLEVAEALALAPVKPKRSIIFVWHTGEEAGLLGSAFFVENPTVPREKIVAQINMDMIGRGRAEDLPGGGPDYVAVVGAERLSSDLGKMVQDVNRAQRRPLRLDYRFDSATTFAGYNDIYNRSDHANYARRNIPIAFFFTGLHGDYHQLTDEPAYIDYPHYTRIVNYVRDLVVRVGDAPARPRVDRTGGQQ